MKKSTTTRASKGPANAKISRTTLIQSTDLSAGGTFNGAIKFTLGNLPDYTDFSLYDQYRIDSIELLFVPSLNVSTTKGTAGTDVRQLPILTTCLDKDDAITPTVSQVQQHQTCVVHGIFDRNVRVHLDKPQVSLSAYQGAFTGYAQKASQWIDTASSGVEHYGVKWSIENAPTSASANYLFVYAKYNMSFRYPI
jgi:hypothetical protein